MNDETKDVNKEGGEEETVIETDETLDDSVIAEDHLSDTVKKLRKKLKKCEAERQEYLTGWQKDKADFINARKRDEEEKKNFIKFASERVIMDIIPVLDSFDMAMGNKEAWEKADKNWRMGVEYIASQLRKALQDHGLSEINPLGEKFDPALHEAAEYVPTDNESKDHTVIDVIQKGYSLNGKILKPARVKVGEFKKDES